MVHMTVQDPSYVRHQGGCHCGAVRFQVIAAPIITAYQCNCSMCVKKQYKYVTVPFSQFKLVKGHDALRTYTYDDAHAAKYNFCSTCGVQVLHLPNNDPETYGLALHCLDEGTIKKVNHEKVDAQGQPRRKTSIIEHLSAKTQQVGRKTSSTEKPDGKLLTQQQQPTRKTSAVDKPDAKESTSPRKISLIDKIDFRSLGQSTRKISITTKAPTETSSQDERSA